MKSIAIIVKEQIENKHMIWNLAKYELNNKYASNALGSAWLLLNPLIQIGLFWFVFGLGIRGGGPVGDIPFIVWLLAGIIPWFYVSGAISSGATSINQKLNVASKMNFPLSIIPTYVLISELLIHAILLTFIPISMLIFGVNFTGFNILRLFYSIFTTTIFLTALAYVTSTVTSIVKDLNLLIQHIVRLTMWMTPIMWQSVGTGRMYRFILMLNPVYYLISGYRTAFLYSNTASINLRHSLYFWTVTLVLLMIGTRIHIKFRREFIDYL